MASENVTVMCNSHRSGSVEMVERYSHLDEMTNGELEQTVQWECPECHASVTTKLTTNH